ncbi:hypothetical protein [Cedecea sp. NFIX57]|uniref:hypothetical protein n=1 Tax=Cedecea sp. NFIX57 TaxID=1566286 RepID=UPI00111C2237|nr:hypothetical protein [Cedecea sp. NFIX57]NIG74935.1 hypothetical protein [Klebsiella sp. Ap-873]
MKSINIILLTATILISSCSSSPKPDGTCAMMSYGKCVLIWQDGEKIPFEGVDVRYDGLKMLWGNGFGGTVKVHN